MYVNKYGLDKKSYYLTTKEDRCPIKPVADWFAFSKWDEGIVNAATDEEVPRFDIGTANPSEK